MPKKNNFFDCFAERLRKGLSRYKSGVQFKEVVNSVLKAVFFGRFFISTDIEDLTGVKNQKI